MKILLSILFVFVLGTVHGQQQQMVIPSQISHNMLQFNPSYSGYKETMVAAVRHRTTWMGFGDFSTQNFGLHFPMKGENASIGLQAKHESAGIVDFSEVFMNYSYRILLGDNRLAFGLNLGVQSVGADEANTPEEGDPAFDASKTVVNPNSGFGISYYSETFHAGLSVPYFMKYNYSDEKIGFGAEHLSYVLVAGGELQLNRNLALQPSGNLIYNMLYPVQFTANINLKYNNMFTLGGGYRLNEGIIANVGFNLNRQLAFMFSYDYNIGQIGEFSDGSVEVGMFYYFGYKIETVNIRDF